MPAISIIMPVYNAQSWLKRAVESVLAQTMRDFELILINDGSSDASPEMCNAFAAGDARIRVIHQENRGQGMARNAGLDAALGAYIGFVDDDDYIFPDYYERMYKKAAAGGYDVVRCSIFEIDNDTLAPPYPREIGQVQQLGVFYPTTTAGEMNGSDFLRNLVLGARDGAAWDLLIRAPVCGKLRFPARSFEDGFFCAELSTSAKTFFHITDMYYVWVQHSASTIKTYPATAIIDRMKYRMLLFEKSGFFAMEDCVAQSYKLVSSIFTKNTEQITSLLDSGKVREDIAEISAFIKKNVRYLSAG